MITFWWCSWFFWLGFDHKPTYCYVLLLSILYIISVTMHRADYWELFCTTTCISLFIHWTFWKLESIFFIMLPRSCHIISHSSLCRNPDGLRYYSHYYGTDSICSRAQLCRTELRPCNAGTIRAARELICCDDSLFQGYPGWSPPTTTFSTFVVVHF